MRRITGKKGQKEPVALILVLFLFGMLAGILFAGLVKVLEGKEMLVNEEYLKCLLTEEIDGADLFFYTVWEHVKELLLFFLLVMTWLNLPYAIFHLLRQGFFLGFLVSVFLKAYQMRGLILACAYYVPQCLLQIPLWLFCYQISWRVWEERKNRRSVLGTELGKEEEMQQNEKISLHKLNMLHLDGKSAMLILGICLAASALEVWPGTWILKKVVEWIL